MKNARKRLLSLLLTLVLVIGMIPVTASATTNITGTWQTDITMSAADLGVNAPDSVLRATLTFSDDGHVTADWEALDLTAFRLFFHNMFVNAYYAVAYSAGITDINEIEQYCMNSTGMSVSAYMDTIVTNEAMIAAFTPASTQGQYLLQDNNVYLDITLMGNTSNPDIPNPITFDGSTMYLNAASFGQSNYTFACNRISAPIEENPLTNGNPIGEPIQAGYWYNDMSNTYVIHGITSQRLDNDHYRFTVSYTAPAGSLIWVTSTSTDQPLEKHWQLDGSGTFSFDLPNLDFYTYYTPDWHLMISGTDSCSSVWIKGNGSYLTGGLATGIAFTPDYSFEDSHLAQVHSISAQALDNDCVRYTIEYTANDVLNISVFNPPSGDYFMYYGIPTVPGQRSSLTFDVDNSWLDSISGITFKFFKSEEESAYGYITLAAQEEPVSNTFPVGYWYSNSDGAVIHSIECEYMDSGDTRYTVVTTTGPGMYLDVYRDTGDQLYHVPLFEGTSTMCFDVCPYQRSTGEWHILITDGNTVYAQASLTGDGSNNSGGNPTDSPFTPYYNSPDSELVNVHGVTAQYLDNGYIRFSVDCTTNTNMNITAFDPPSGDLFSCRSIPTVSGARTTFIFDVQEAHLRSSGLTLNFYDHNYGPTFMEIDAFRN